LPCAADLLACLRREGGTVPAGEDDVRAFAKAFTEMLEWVHQPVSDDRGNEVVALVREWLGAERLQHSVVRRDLPPFEHVNLQVALDAWGAEPGRQVHVHGLVTPPHFGSVALQMLLYGDGLPPVRLGAPNLVDLPTGPDRTLACLRQGVLLVEDGRGRSVLLVKGPDPQQGEGLSVEVAGLPTEQAQQLLGELAVLQSRLNVYRGQILELEAGQFGVEVVFPRLPATARTDVVLPEQVLRRVERHSLDMAARREQLRAAGQHLKRGLLLHGPPGTGKTHTVRYVHMVGSVTALARDLQPAAVVLEDVDLVAEDRAYGPGPAPVLFELLDAMDGAAEDADLLFLLTTNRADLLEPALAARPGRVDVAGEIGLPDAAARLRLLEVYSRGVPLELTDDDRALAVERMAGVTASFVKELLRRAVLEALTETAGDLQVVTAEHLQRRWTTCWTAASRSPGPARRAGRPERPPPAQPLGHGAGPFGHGGRGHGRHGGWFAGPGVDAASMPLAYDSSVDIVFDPVPEPPGPGLDADPAAADSDLPTGATGRRRRPCRAAPSSARSPRRAAGRPARTAGRGPPRASSRTATG
jgi:hypothetical protein